MSVNLKVTGNTSEPGLYIAHWKNWTDVQFTRDLTIWFNIIYGVLLSGSETIITCETMCSLSTSVPSTDNQASISCIPWDITLTESPSVSVTSNWFGVSVYSTLPTAYWTERTPPSPLIFKFNVLATAPVYVYNKDIVAPVIGCCHSFRNVSFNSVFVTLWNTT